MRASVLHDVGRLEVRDVPVPSVGPHDVLVRTSAVGLCGTDLHIFGGEANYNSDEHGKPIPLTVEPQILGHEITGVVEEVGAEVDALAPGDRVVCDQGINCVSARRAEHCEYCATGDSHQCAHYVEHGIAGLPGALADFIALPAVNAVKIEGEVDAAEAALSEPLGCIVHACDFAMRARGARYALDASDPARRARSILIFGAGPAGLLFTQYLRAVLGFDGLLVVSEPSQRKRELAAGFGAEVVDPSAVDIVEAIADLTDGRRVECVVDASGAGRVFTVLPGVLRKQGTIVLYGHGHGGVDLSVLNSVQFLEPTLVASVGASGGFESDGRPSTYVRALRLIEAGTVKVAPIVTHRYHALEDVERAFTADYHTPEYVKGVVMLDRGAAKRPDHTSSSTT